ncbi:MAG TPA: helix-turn-helix transcriptional regulator [Planctomycetota bacterium]|nr:helix-turn-helix transcriptional regulator [Planctomycetota bacterium]
MSRSPKAPDDLLPLTPAVFHILLALADRDRHGYAIMTEVESATGGRLRMGPGTLYGSIKRMIAAKLIEESDVRPAEDQDDERRRYYRLTPFGRKVAAAESRRVADLAAVARSKGLTRPAFGKG